MVDTFINYTPSLESPAANLFEVAPDDAADLPFVTRGLNVSSSGTVRITTLGGDEATVYIAAGIIFPVRVRRVFASGTTATSIVAMY